MSDASAARPVRVTFIIGSLDIGGAERQVVRLANRLDRRRFRPSIICWFGGGALEAELDRDIPLVKLQLSRVARARPGLRIVVAARLLLRFARAIRAQRPDVVNAYMFTAYVLGALAARLAGVPVVVASRRGLVSYRSYPRRWHWMARLANRFIDLHLCNSEAVRRWAIDKEAIPLERTEVVYNGLDVPAPAPAPALPHQWRRPGGSLAAIVANFHVYKGHAVLLDAVARVVDRHPEFRVVLFGDGDERARLEAQAESLQITTNVVFAGARLDAATLLPDFDFTILTSFEEGFPNAVMESMAVGVPVVASDVGGIPELVEDGIEGRLVPVRDAAALAEALDWMIQHTEERAAMGAAARRRIEQQFSVDRMVERTEATYLRLLGRTAPSRVVAEAG